MFGHIRREIDPVVQVVRARAFDEAPLRPIELAIRLGERLAEILAIRAAISAGGRMPLTTTG